MLKKYFVVVILFLTNSLLINLSNAQSLSQQEQQALSSNASSTIPLDNYINTRSGQSGSTSGRSFSSDASGSPLPFGASLFDQSAPTFQRSSVNPQYIISVGDKVSVQLWGAFDLAQVYTVDNQGNVFIDSVGPVKIEGLFAKDLNQAVTSKIKQVYTDNVQIYVNLLASTPVSVFVTGNINKPGQYAGHAADTILYYLRQAGGISADYGSYRNINVLRGSSTVLNVDLYDFLVEGRLSSFSFQDGDVILVRDKQDFVIVEGMDTDSKISYELDQSERTGKSIIKLAQLSPRVSHVAITGIRDSKPISSYIPIDEFSNFELSRGDTLLFNEDIKAQVISVQISGSFLGPSFYALKTHTQLHELLDQIEVDPKQADTSSIYILRESVKEQQAMLLEESLNRLERNVFTAPSSSDGEASLRAQEAQLVSQFIDRARQVEPLGKVVVSIDGEVADIRLEQGDEIVIPQYSDLINVSGEVMLPQAVVYKPDASISDYIDWAGGYTDRADKAALVIVHANGLTSIVEHDKFWFDSSSQLQLKPGDQLIITPKANSKLMQTFKDVTQIIFQIAVAANVATN